MSSASSSVNNSPRARTNAHATSARSRWKGCSTDASCVSLTCTLFARSFLSTCFTLLTTWSFATQELASVWFVTCLANLGGRPGLEKLRAESKKTIYGPITFNNLRIKDEKVKNSKRATGDFVKLKAGILIILYMAGSQCLSSLYPGPLLLGGIGVTCELCRFDIHMECILAVCNTSPPDKTEASGTKSGGLKPEGGQPSWSS
ncbi:hypothetical protein YC2023_049114 [Brassica napus]